MLGTEGRLGLKSSYLEGFLLPSILEIPICPVQCGEWSSLVTSPLSGCMELDGIQLFLQRNQLMTDGGSERGLESLRLVFRQG